MLAFFVSLLELLLFSVASASEACPTHAVVTRETTNFLKRTAPWKVTDYNANIFRGWTLRDVRHILSTLHKKTTDNKPVNPKPKAPHVEFTAFDPREIMAECIHGVMSEGHCAASWAVPTVHALGDRFCRNGKKQAALLSPQLLLACDNTDYGCRGGYVMRALQFLEATGTATEECIPYESSDGNPGPCPQKCKNGSPIEYFQCQENSVRDISYDIDAIKVELTTRGPVALSMEVFEDFLYYRRGVYKHVHGNELLGRQGLRAVGFGNENGQEYWICANSWGEAWGDAGWVKVAFREVEIEEDVWTCDPLIV